MGTFMTVEMCFGTFYVLIGTLIVVYVVFGRSGLYPAARAGRAIRQHYRAHRWFVHTRKCCRCALVVRAEGSVTALCSIGRDLGYAATGCYWPEAEATRRQLRDTTTSTLLH